MVGFGSPFPTGGGLYNVSLLFTGGLLTFVVEGMEMGRVNLRVFVIPDAEGFCLWREGNVDHSSSGSLNEAYAVTARFCFEGARCPEVDWLMRASGEAGREEETGKSVAENVLATAVC
jgi:hypothetical protein